MNSQQRQQMEEVSRFIDYYNRAPSVNSDDPTEKYLGLWLSIQKRDYKRGMMNENRRVVWEQFMILYAPFFMEEEEWDERYVELKTFMDENARRPASMSKDPAEKKLGYWLSTQRQQYKNNSQGMTDPNRRAKWENVVNEYPAYFRTIEEKWDDNLDDLTRFMDENNDRPSSASVNCEEKKLGRWVHHQKSTYKSKTNGMKDPVRRQKWENVMKEYPQLIRDHEDNWNEVRKFIERTGKIPNRESTDDDEKLLSKWLNRNGHH